LKSASAEFKRTLDPRHGSTSYFERQNLTMRMMRRSPQLTNGFSKKAENLAAAVSHVPEVV
jgi:hypothetical protein